MVAKNTGIIYSWSCETAPILNHDTTPGHCKLSRFTERGRVFPITESWRDDDTNSTNEYISCERVSKPLSFIETL